MEPARSTPSARRRAPELARIALLGVLAAVASSTSLALAAASLHASVRAQLETSLGHAVIVRSATATAACSLEDASCVPDREHLTAALASEIVSVLGGDRVSQLTQGSATLRADGAPDRTVRVAGTESGWLRAQPIGWRSGRGFTETEDRLGHPVALLGVRLADSLARVVGSVPTLVRVAGRELRVIGVIETGVSAFVDLDAAVVAPLRLVSRGLGIATADRAVLVALPDPRPGSRDRAELVGTLRQIARLRPNDRLELEVMGYAEMRSDLDALWRRIRFLLAQLSLVLAFASSVGIGALQTTLARARQREFGLKRALGARRIDILMEGVHSSLRLTGLGVLAGALLAVLAALGIAQGFGLVLADVLPSVAVGGLPALAGGVLAGVFTYSRVVKRTPADLLGQET